MNWSRIPHSLIALTAAMLVTACDKGLQSPTGPTGIGDSKSPVVCEAVLWGHVGRGEGNTFGEARQLSISKCLNNGSAKDSDYAYRRALGICNYTLRCTSTDSAAPVGPWFSCTTKTPLGSINGLSFQSGGPSISQAHADGFQLCQIYAGNTVCEPARDPSSATCAQNF